ncbi:MAG: DUF4136 domain-containing protein [Flavisolibacter sp.]
MKFLSVSYICLMALVMASSCSPSLKVTSDYDKTVNFTQFKTFSIEKIDDATKQSLSQLNLDRISNAIRASLTKKGLQESESADLLVHTAAIIKNKQSVSSTTNYYGYGGYYRPYMWGGGAGASGYTTYNVQDYKDGSLIIDLVDSKTQKLVWEGVGNKEIDTPKDPEKAINAAVESIMAGYPPGAGKKS